MESDQSRSSTVTAGVIIPSFNNMEFLKECIESVFSQTTPFDQIILIDDCSEDDTYIFIDRLSKEHPEVVAWRNNTNIGPIESINLGIQRCSADYVLFLSANDKLHRNLVFWLKTCVKSEVGAFSALCKNFTHGTRSLKARKTPVIAHKKRVYSASDTKTLVAHYTNWVTGTTMFLNRELVVSKNMLNPNLGGVADWLLFIVCALEKGGIFLPKYLGYVRLHPCSFLEQTLCRNLALESEAVTYVKATAGKHRLPNKSLRKIKQRIQYNQLKAQLLSSRQVGFSLQLTLRIRLVYSVLNALALYRTQLPKFLLSKFIFHRCLDSSAKSKQDMFPIFNKHKD